MTLTKVVGAPAVTGTPTYRLFIQQESPYMGGSPLYRLQYDYVQERWEDLDNSSNQAFIPMALDGDVAPEGHLIVQAVVQYPGQPPATSTLRRRAVATQQDPPEWDWRVPLSVRVVSSEIFSVDYAAMLTATTAANAAASAAETAASTANTAAASATSAAGNASTAAGQATTAASAANTAAGSANTAASSANTAASNANSAATAANSAANSATTAAEQALSAAEAGEAASAAATAANSAAVSANNAANSANTAAASATSAAGNASTAAGQATTAASAANTAAGSANTAASSANTAASNADAATARAAELKYVGIWSNSTNYKELNLVRSGNKFYAARQNNVGRDPSTPNTNYWALVAQDGAGGGGSSDWGDLTNVPTTLEGFGLLGEVQALAGSGSPRVIYASQIPGIALNGSLTAATGTDDTTLLQAELDGGNVVLVLDGIALVSGLTLDDNTGIVCLPGCGLSLKTGSNRAVLQNRHWNSSTQRNKNIWLQNLTWYGNPANQVHDNAGDFVAGIRFFRVDGLYLQGTTQSLYSKTFAAWIGNATGVYVEDFEIVADTSSLANQDGVHFNGPASNVRIGSVRGASNDDILAFNADDGFRIDSPGLTFIPYGDITDVHVGVVSMLGNTTSGVRLLSATSRIDRIHIERITGKTRAWALNVSPFTLQSIGTGNVGNISVGEIDADMTADIAYPETSNLVYLNGAAESLHIGRIVRTNPALTTPTVRVASNASSSGRGSANIQQLSIGEVLSRDANNRTLTHLLIEGTVQNLMLGAWDNQIAATHTMVSVTGTLSNRSGNYYPVQQPIRARFTSNETQYFAVEQAYSVAGEWKVGLGTISYAVNGVEKFIPFTMTKGDTLAITCSGISGGYCSVTLSSLTRGLQTTFTDTFTRADGAPGASYTTLLGGMTISGNKLVGTSGENQVGIVDVASFVDGEFEAVLTPGTALSYRTQGGSYTQRYFYQYQTNGPINVYRQDGPGSFTQLGANLATYGGARTLKVVVVGSLHRFFIDGVEVGSRTDSTYATGKLALQIINDGFASGTIDSISVRQ